MRPEGGGGPPSSWEPRSTTIYAVVSREEFEEKDKFGVRCKIIISREKTKY